MFDGPMKEMMKQAQKMTEQMKEAHDALLEKEVTGEAGAGLVSGSTQWQGRLLRCRDQPQCPHRRPDHRR